MKRIMTLIMLSLATVVQAGEQKIVETEAGITVEYTGSSAPAQGGADSAAALANDYSQRVQSLTAQVEQLRREAADILQMTGAESAEEIALKKALAEEKRLQIEACSKELGQLAGTGAAAADASPPQADKPVRAPNYRAEKKQQIRDLKMLRMTAPP
jgi:hypothetical protein